MNDYFFMNYIINNDFTKREINKIIKQEKSIVISDFKSFCSIPEEKYLAFEYIDGIDVYIIFNESTEVIIKSTSNNKKEVINDFILKSGVLNLLDFLNRKMIIKCKYSSLADDLYAFSVYFLDEMYSPCVYEMLNIFSDLSLPTTPFIYKEFLLKKDSSTFNRLVDFSSGNSLILEGSKSCGIYLVPVSGAYSKIRENYIIKQ